MNRKLSKIGAALITGGAKRIGRSIALQLALQGYDIAISYNKSASEAKKLASEIEEKYSVNCEIFCADLCEKDAAKNLAEEVVKKFPHWNLLINNASIFYKSKFTTESDAELFDNLNLHLISPMFLAKEFAKNIKKNFLKDAQIINMVDKNIVRFDTSYFYYLLTKKFLAELTKMLALELAPEIRVNGVAPGFILKPIDKNMEDSEVERIINKIPLQSKGDTQNICQAIEFLLLNKFVTGQILFIDGGASLNHSG